MTHNPDDLTVNPVQTVSDQDLIEELLKRSLASDRHGMIIAFAKPKEGSPDLSDGLIAFASRESGLLTHLVAAVAQEAGVGVSQGRIAVPPIHFEKQDEPYIVVSVIRPMSFNSVEDIKFWFQKGLQLEPLNEAGTEFNCHYAGADLIKLFVERGYTCEPLSGHRVIFHKPDSDIRLLWTSHPKSVVSILPAMEDY